MAPVILIPHRLSYGPTGSAASDQARLAFGNITAPEFRGGRYEVCHYLKRQLGGCVGPLAVDQTLWFSHELDVRLQEEGRLVAVEYEPEERQNVAVVVGAYLVLGLGWSADEVRGALPEDAGLTLPCSWIDLRDLRTSHGAPCMTVQDCWEGVQIARDLGWLRKEVVKDGVMASLAASKFWKASCEYDGAWLVPGAIFVMADPMTVIKDPSPNTCAAFCRVQSTGSDRISEMASLDWLRMCSGATCQEKAAFRSQSKDKSIRSQSKDIGLADVFEEVAPSTTANGRDCDEFKHTFTRCTSSSTANGLDGASVHTVCKVYGSGGARAEGSWPDARPFVNFLLEAGIKTVLRVNASDEPGLAEIGGSYDARLLAEFGIQHADLPVSDSKATLGALPPRGIVMRLLSLTGHVGSEDGGAVLVHCKGGFGRSVFLACLLTIYKYDVSGRGLLGWARIARPGAITTSEQEAALRSLSGRVDLCRRYGIPCECPDGASGAQGCCAVS